MKKAIDRASLAPFESAIAILLMISGLIVIGNFGPPDPIALILPVWEAYVLAGVFIATGIFILAGIALNNVGVEAAGLLLLVASLISRLILYGYYLGLDATFAVTSTLDVVFIVAAFLRLFASRKRVIITFREGGGSDVLPGSGSGTTSGI